MTEKRFYIDTIDGGESVLTENSVELGLYETCDLLNELHNENQELKKELKRYKDWINSDNNDYELTLSFIKNKGYSLKDVLEYEKELKK